MKKLGLYLLLTILASYSSVQAQEAEQNQTEPQIPNKLMLETLSLSYGAPVELTIDENNCQVLYPAVEIKEIATPAQDETTQDQNIEDKVIITPIAATTAKCSPINDFNGLPQYKVEHTSSDKLLAQIYNYLEIPAVKDINIKTFKEEQTIVPQLGLISSEKIHIADAVYTEKDEETGLKNEIGNLQELTWQENVSHSADTIKYYTDIQMHNFNLVLPIFSMHIDSEHQAAEVIYKNDDKKPFDYTNLLQNLSAFTSSRSRAVAKGIRLKSDLFNMGITYDIEIKNQAKTKSNGLLDSSGNIAFNNIVFTGDMLPKHQQPQSIALEMAVNHLQLNNLVQLAQMQQEILSNDNAEIDEEKMIAILDEILDTANFIADIRVKFAHADISSHFKLHRKDNYLQGEGKITINNLFGIFPEIKTCQQNPQDPQCTQNMILTELSTYLDISKNNSVNTLKYTSTGVFLNNKKIAEPIKIDLREIIQNNDENESDNSASDIQESEDIE